MEKGWIYRRIELNQLLKKLQSHPHIKASKTFNYFKVRFQQTKITEYWALNQKAYEDRTFYCYRFPNKGPYFKTPIKTYKQFETDPFQTTVLDKHFIITQKQIQQAGWCDLRFKIHELVKKFSEIDLNFQFTDELLKTELEELKNSNVGLHEASLIRYQLYPRRLTPKARRLRIQFMPWQEAIEPHWRRKRTMYAAINSLLIKEKDITFENLWREFECHLPPLVCPGFYRAIFRRYFPVDNLRILDYEPDWGNKALAITLEGGIYVSEKPQDHTVLLNYTGGKSEIGLSGDAVILSSHFPLSAEEAIRRISLFPGISKMVLIDPKESQKVLNLYKPKQNLRVETSIPSNAHNDARLLIL